MSGLERAAPREDGELVCVPRRGARTEAGLKRGGSPQAHSAGTGHTGGDGTSIWTVWISTCYKSYSVFLYSISIAIGIQGGDPSFERLETPNHFPTHPRFGAPVGSLSQKTRRSVRVVPWPDFRDQLLIHSLKMSFCPLRAVNSHLPQSTRGRPSMLAAVHQVAHAPLLSHAAAAAARRGDCTSRQC